MQVGVQNRSVVYDDGPVLVPEGVHRADLVDAYEVGSAFGPRVALVFRLIEGPYAGHDLMQSAAATRSRRGKLAELLHGFGGIEGTLAAAQQVVGRRGRIAVRHETTAAGRTYAAIVQTFT